MSDTPHETEKWVEERVARSEQRMETMEARVERMTDDVKNEVSRLADQQEITRNVSIGIGTAIFLAIISLFIYALNQTNDVQEQVLENTKRIEQVGPSSGGTGSASGQDTTETK